jgi:hypothetical protein
MFQGPGGERELVLADLWRLTRPHVRFRTIVRSRPLPRADTPVEWTRSCASLPSSFAE